MHLVVVHIESMMIVFHILFRSMKSTARAQGGICSTFLELWNVSLVLCQLVRVLRTCKRCLKSLSHFVALHKGQTYNFPLVNPFFLVFWSLSRKRRKSIHRHDCNGLHCTISLSEFAVLCWLWISSVPEGRLLHCWLGNKNQVLLADAERTLTRIYYQGQRMKNALPLQTWFAHTKFGCPHLEWGDEERR